MVSQLYDAETGELIGPIDEGEGLRQKSFLDEIYRQLQEAAHAGASGLRMANFPAVHTGEQLSSNPIGQAPVTGDFSGVSAFFARSQRAVLATGDGTETDFGGEALSEDDPTHANYFNTTTDPDDPVDPRGGQAPAFLQTLADGGGFNLSTSDGILTVEINGEQFTVDLGTGGSVGVAAIRDAILVAGWPVNLAIEGTDTLRIFAPGRGITSNIRVDGTAGTAGAVLFDGTSQSSQTDVLYRGTNGPLGEMGNTGVVNGAKPQRRILPGSITITMTMGGEEIEVTDDTINAGETTGTLSGESADGSVTVTGTINYVTGAIDLDTAGDAPDAATDVDAHWWALIPIPLDREVRVPVGQGHNYALLAK